MILGCTWWWLSWDGSVWCEGEEGWPRRSFIITARRVKERDFTRHAGYGEVSALFDFSSRVKKNGNEIIHPNKHNWGLLEAAVQEAPLQPLSNRLLVNVLFLKRDEAMKPIVIRHPLPWQRALHNKSYCHCYCDTNVHSKHVKRDFMNGLIWCFDDSPVSCFNKDYSDLSLQTDLTAAEEEEKWKCW